MAERSFVEEVKKLRLKEGELFRGEGILAVTKALLESGVAYVAGYQGAPISHLMDVLVDAQDILAEHGIHFENSASEATEGLAPLVREEIWRVLAVLREAGHAMLVIDKYVRRLIRLADRHVVLEKGRVVWAGSSEALAEDCGVWHRHLGV